MKKRRIIACVMAVTMVMTGILTGCGSSKEAESAASESSATAEKSKTPAAKEKEEGTSAGEPVTITFWDDNAGDQRTEFWMQMIENFEKENPDVKIEYLGVPISDIQSKYLTALSGGETPDVGLLVNTWANKVISQGHCVALDDMFNAWEESANISESYLNAFRNIDPEGKLYAVPYSAIANCAWFNEQMFADAGLDYPDTWDDFFAAAEKLTDKDKGQYGYTIRGGAGGAAELFSYIYGYLGTDELFDAEGKFTINSPEAAAFVEKYLGLYGSATPESDITAGYKEISANFDSGISAMVFHNVGSYGSHVDAFGGTEGFVCYPLPQSMKGVYAGKVSVSGITMFDTCENPEAAWKWISYIMSHEGNSFWNESIGQIPVNSACSEDPWMAEAEHLKTLGENMGTEGFVLFDAATYLPEWGTILTDYVEPSIQSVMSGDMTAQELLDGWAERVNEAYANYTAN